MITRKLVYYINKGLARGLSLTELKNALISVGWSQEDIDKAANIALGKRQQTTAYPEASYKESYKASYDKQQGWKEKKPRTLIVAALFCAIILSGLAVYFLFFDGVDFLRKAPVNCGFDIECFNDLAVKCIPVTLQTESLFSKEYYEIKGLQSGFCIWRMESEVLSIENEWMFWGIECKIHLDELKLSAENVIMPSSLRELGERCTTFYKD